jgi:hypothetical protein
MLLDRIKLRNLLNIAQEELAMQTKLTDTCIGASLIWRQRLGYDGDSVTRLATAHELLNQHHPELSDRTKRFSDSAEGMRLVTEKISEIRERGDKVAHQTPPARSIYTGALTRAESEGMRAIADFVCV